jgi:hypothetical protein
VAPPGNQAETEKTNINLQHRKKPVYSTNQLIIKANHPKIGYQLVL